MCSIDGVICIDLYFQQAQGWTPVRLAIELHDSRVLRHLLAIHCLDWDAPDSKGLSPKDRIERNEELKMVYDSIVVQKKQSILVRRTVCRIEPHMDCFVNVIICCVLS